MPAVAVVEAEVAVDPAAVTPVVAEVAAPAAVVAGDAGDSCHPIDRGTAKEMNELRDRSRSFFL